MIARSIRALVILGGRSTDRPLVGVQMRRHHLLRAAGRVASLEIFVLDELDDQALDEMSSIYAARVGCVHSTAAPRSRVVRLLRYLRHAGSPARVGRKDWRALRQELRAWMSKYQITLVERVEDYLVLAPILQAPIVVDQDDRESDVLRQMRPLLRKAEEGHRRRPWLAGWWFSATKNAGRDLYLMLDQYRWLRAERLVMRRADSVLVASHEDLITSANPRKGVVVPNGFELRGSPVGSDDVRTPPTVAFWGLLSYRPNRDGAQWFLGEVLPLLVSRTADVRVLLIGGGGEHLTLPERGHVVVTGLVDDLSVFLSETDVAVVPLRTGAGTRIKIIEAWANNIPVVSTSRGAYGLGAIDGENVLLADEPEAFARAIALALESPSVRHHLIVEGAARARALRWSTIERDLSNHLSLMAAPDV
jgi:glycosyltransferase involved in cell wall biosynthesis